MGSNYRSDGLLKLLNLPSSGPVSICLVGMTIGDIAVAEPREWFFSLALVTSRCGSERLCRLLKESILVVLGQGMAVAGALVGVRLMTGLLSPSEYGELALGMTVAALINLTVLGPLYNGVTRFYAPAQEKDDLGGYLHAVGRLLISATGIIIILILPTVSGLLIAGRMEWIALAVAAFILSIISGYNLIVNGIQNAARNRIIVALHQGIETWGRFLCAAGLMLWLGATSTIAMIGYAIAAILTLGSQSVFLHKVVTGNIEEGENKNHWMDQIWTYSWPFATWGIFAWLQMASDRWALGLVGTLEDVGRYAVLYQLGYYPMSVVTGMATQLFAPIFYQRAGDGTDSRRNTNVNTLSWRVTWSTLGVTGSTFVLAFFSHRQIFHLFVAEEYTSVSHLLPWMLLAGGVFAASQSISLGLMSRMKTHTLNMAKIMTALLGTTFNFAGAYWYGVAGLVMAAILFSAVDFVWMVLISRNDVQL